jgi:hypothetical protein
MRILALLAVLASGLVLARAERSRATSRSGDRQFPGRSLQPALFELAPASGAGMAAVCGCSNPTGSKGESLTFTRASTAFCTKGNTTTGLVDGDLVSCGNDLARVMPGGDGTGGAGILIEEARSNGALRSSELDNAYWGKSSAGSSPGPVVWANDAGAIDGTATADAVHYSPTSPVNDASRAFGAALANSLTSVCSLYVKGAVPVDGGVAQSGTFDVILDGVSNGFLCGTCSYSASTTTRCVTGAKADTGGTGNLLLGNDSRTATCSNASRPAQDVITWGVQCEVPASGAETSYIPTTSAGVARVKEVASVALSVTGQVRSFADTWVAPSVLTNGATMIQLFTDSSNDLRAEVQSSKLRCTFKIGGVSTTVDSTGNLTASASNRVACYSDGATIGACIGGVCNTSAQALTLPTTTTVVIGSRSGGFSHANGVHKRICVDNVSASRCQ